METQTLLAESTDIRMTGGEDTPAAASSASRNKNVLEWDNLSFFVGEKCILNNVSGQLRRGELCALLGPSGAGKSTLLNVLSGRQLRNGNGFRTEGSVKYSGKEVNAQQLKKSVAFIMQDDALTAVQTVKEALMFSARLRLTDVTDEKVLHEQVDTLIDRLGLKDCKDTFIGNDLMKGISGGERKRVSVGMELVTTPKMIFLDEPTSGLDSFAAMKLLDFLKTVAVDNDAIVCCTVHQPSSELFERFDRVMCLRKGELMLHGKYSACVAKHASFTDADGNPTSAKKSVLPPENLLMDEGAGGNVTGVLDFLEAHNRPCPQNYNPADWILFLAQTIDDEEAEKICAAAKESVRKEVGVTATSILPTPQRNNSSSNNRLSSDAQLLQRQRASVNAQFKALFIRECHKTFRNKVALIIRFTFATIFALMYGVVFYNNGKSVEELNKMNPGELRTALGNSMGPLTAVLIAAMFGTAQPMLLTFPAERAVFLREYASNMYSSSAYVVTKTLLEIPLSVAQMGVMALIAKPLIGLEGNIFMIWFVMFLLTMASASIALMLSASVKQAEGAIQFAPVLFVPQMLFSGVFSSASQVLGGAEWVQYFVPLKYGVNTAVWTTFSNAAENGKPVVKAAVRQLLIAQSIAYDGYNAETGIYDTTGRWPHNTEKSWSFWLQIFVLILIILVCRVIATYVLRNKGQSLM